MSQKFTMVLSIFSQYPKQDTALRKIPASGTSQKKAKPVEASAFT
jgi:hypothetical protein